MTSLAFKSPASPAAVSLEELRRRARSPEAEREDIDALVVALRRPVWPGQDVRGRAEVLNRIIEDPFLSSLLGDGGTRVEGAAARALGEPHASTLSAKARAALEHAPAEGALSAPDEDEEAPSEKSEASEGSRGVETEPTRAAGRPFWLTLIGGFLMAFSPFEISMEAMDWGGGELAFACAIFFVLVTLILPVTLVTNRRPRFSRLNYLGGFLIAAPTIWGFSGTPRGVMIGVTRGVLLVCLLIAAITHPRDP